MEPKWDSVWKQRNAECGSGLLLRWLLRMGGSHRGREGLRLSDIQSHPEPANFSSANFRGLGRETPGWPGAPPHAANPPQQIMPQASGRGCGQPHEGDGGVLGTGERERRVGKSMSMGCWTLRKSLKVASRGWDGKGFSRSLAQGEGGGRWLARCDWLDTHFLVTLSRRLWVEETDRGRAHAVTPCVGPLQRLQGHWDRASFGKIWGPAGRSMRRRPAAV